VFKDETRLNIKKPIKKVKKISYSLLKDKKNTPFKSTLKSSQSLIQVRCTLDCFDFYYEKKKQQQLLDILNIEIILKK